VAKFSLVSRYILGLIYFVFGLNGFLNFIPAPPPAENILPFMTGLMSTGYFFPFLKATEVICGLLLLTGMFAPLALIILAPITIQIFLFHAVMTPQLQMIVMPVAMIVLHIAAARAYWNLYQPLLKVK
jgi:putative oxidoreductase